MKSVVLKDPGGVDSLALVEGPAPEPGPGQVVVRMRAAALNYRDLLVVHGGYGSKQRTENLVPLCDGAGEVTAAGEGATRFQVGDRVMANPFRHWISGPPTEAKLASSIGSMLDGCLSEVRVFDEDALVATPSHLSDVEAAACPCAGLTAWSAIVTQGAVAPGDVVLIQGTGGVSLFALLFAKLAGAVAIVTSSSDEKLERVRALGADHLINYRSDTQWGKTARAITGGRGVDHVVEVGGADTLKQSMLSIRPAGTIYMIGVLSGARHELVLPPIVMQNMRLQGITVGNRDGLEAMNRAMEANALKPVVGRTFAMEDYKAAWAYLRSGQHFGKIVIEI
jgi:NADPH:quinone reductase-like Zn-dependent oxidoreductase